MISFDDFMKVDLAVAKILSVHEHPNADKLYVIQVDLGTEERQLVAGLREYYSPEQLLGKSVVIVANLEPAVLRGVESQGMLLAVQDGTAVKVIQPETDVASGSRVR